MKKKIFLHDTIIKSSKDKMLENFMIVVAISGHFAIYIQAFKIFTIKSAYAVSLGAYVFMLISCVCWLIYGALKNIRPLIFPNVFAITGIALVLVGIIIYS